MSAETYYNDDGHTVSEAIGRHQRARDHLDDVECSVCGETVTLGTWDGEVVGYQADGHIHEHDVSIGEAWIE